jgi:uncharacterized membrane protein YiaA
LFRYRLLTVFLCVSAVDMTVQPLAVGLYVIIFIASLLHTVAFSTDHWLENNEVIRSTADGITAYHIGLWNACYRSANVNSSNVGNETVTVVATHAVDL